MPTLVMLFALLLVACGSAEPPVCPLGRVEACACPGGSQGAQECGPLGVWSACVCLGGDAGNAVAVADATPDAVVDAPDVPQDATPEITAPDVIAVADVSRDAPDDAPRPIGNEPPAATDHVERMQVWESVNGGPFAYVPAWTCTVTATNAVVLRGLVGSVNVAASGAVIGSTPQCPGSILSPLETPAPVLYRGADGRTRANAVARGAVSPPSPCRDSTFTVERFEVRAFGCTTSP